MHFRISHCMRHPRQRMVHFQNTGYASSKADSKLHMVHNFKPMPVTARVFPCMRKALLAEPYLLQLIPQGCQVALTEL